jgi:sulfate adenylyltransferase subunit 2
MTTRRSFQLSPHLQALEDEGVYVLREAAAEVRAPGHAWNPRDQQPELWRNYNLRLAPGETMRAFPLSNWTESDIWAYIQAEAISIVPLYFAADREVLRRGKAWIAVDDRRLHLHADEKVETRRVRFRTLGCWPLTGAVESDAEDVAAVIDELRVARLSERTGRLVDGARHDSMERKKREGYF